LVKAIGIKVKDKLTLATTFPPINPPCGGIQGQKKTRNFIIKGIPWTSRLSG
jgi:hypothetical protein